MANMKTKVLTIEQYEEIMETLTTGFLNCRPNKKVAFALFLEANLGIRISDIIRLTPNSFIRNGKRYQLDIIEKKTGKARTFTVPVEIMQYIREYCINEKIADNQIIVPLTERAVQKQLKLACDYLGYTGISTHSFRKFFAVNIYIDNDYDIELVKELLQHSSISITERYLDLGDKKREKALENNIKIPKANIF